MATNLLNHKKSLITSNGIKLFAKHFFKLETLIQAVRIFSQDIGMEFGIEKSAMLIMKSRKQQMKKE